MHERPRWCEGDEVNSHGVRRLSGVTSRERRVPTQAILDNIYKLPNVERATGR
jgi:hypothetical protein